MKTPILIAALLFANLMTIAQTKPNKTSLSQTHGPLDPAQVHRSALVIDTHEDTPQDRKSVV